MKATMSILSRLLKALRPIPQPDLHAALQHGQQRIHLFSGNFDDVDAAMAYCFHAPGDVPEQITLDQPGAAEHAAALTYDHVQDAKASLLYYLKQKRETS